MDEAVKTIVIAVGLLACAPAGAQALLDPTRPPPGMDRVQPDAALDGAPRLQSVLIAKRAGGRHVAVIDGETVRLGEHFKGARVAGIKPDEVVLVRGGERQVLRMEAPLAGMTPAAK